MMKYELNYTFTTDEIKNHLLAIGLQESDIVYLKIYNICSQHVSQLGRLSMHFLTYYYDGTIMEKTIKSYINSIVTLKMNALAEEMKFLYNNYATLSPYTRNDSTTETKTYSGTAKTMSENSPENATIGSITTPFIKNNAESGHTESVTDSKKNVYDEYRRFEWIERFTPFITNRCIAIYNSVCEEFQTMY